MIRHTFFLALLTAVPAFSQPVVSIIPEPMSVTRLEGSLTIDQSFTILDPANNFASEIALFKSDVQTLTGWTFSNTGDKQIVLSMSDKLPHPEAYVLTITKAGVVLEGSRAGVFYGLQSLHQLIAANLQPASAILPIVRIEDQPAYSWRGMHLDVCRHFFTKEEVKKYIDYLALHKLNTFHWHLTEDQGWRIEINKYPSLTRVGSKRSGTIIGKYSPTAPSDNVPVTGFYTQSDIREVVAYAAARHITIVPEIEMPGHALAALAAHPEFSCTGGPFQPAITWGVFDDVFCAGNDATFKFLEDVLTEVINLFPGKYIHIGGDECPKTRWKTCAKCQQRMKTEQLADEHELQSYFIQRIEKFVNSRGRQIIGWDEILEGGLAPNASVMSWRGTEGGVAAARQQHSVVMSPGKPCYFDHYQAAETDREPLAIGGFNPLHEVYAYNPTPSELTATEATFILGAQGNMWTEYMVSFKHVEYMALPRMSALAETLWTPASKKDYASFLARLKRHTTILDARKVNYARHFLAD